MADLMAEIHENAFGRLRRGDMTLRDWFAGQALSALIIANDGDISTLRLGNAKDAYQAADSMLAARNNNENKE